MRQKKKRAKLLFKNLTENLAEDLAETIRYLRINLTVMRVAETTIEFVQTEFPI